MKLSLSWIKDYISLPDDLPLHQLARDLTISTVEVEGMTHLSSQFEHMVLGVVQEIQAHPNADRLWLCLTDIGSEVIEIVCGGTNLRKGMKVAVALPGAKLRWHGEGELIELTRAKVRGIVSNGMICSSSEIGLFDLFPFTSEATIMDLSDFDCTAGTSLAKTLDLEDIILEIDNKSLTNRPDLWGHYGVAREIAAIYSLKLLELSACKPVAPNLQVTLHDPSVSPRYIGLRLDGLSTAQAPYHIRSRIWRLGLRPLNGIVDITNYVMLATGQPTHAFDADYLKGNTQVRFASEGERLLLLNGTDIDLTSTDLVIADDEGPIALAGVMGGKRDSILPQTERIFLEIACFEAKGVRRTSSRVGLRTEAATRYEKGIDPERCDLALTLAVELFYGSYPDLTLAGFTDNYPLSQQDKCLTLSFSWLTRRLGKEIPRETIAAILDRLGFKVSYDEDTVNLVIPSWRGTGDVSIPEDIIEEIARIHGFDNFTPQPISIIFEKPVNQRKMDLDREIREYLAFRCGMNEIYTYPWVSDSLINTVIGTTEGMFSLIAPPSPEERLLRSSLIPSLCKAVAQNLHHSDSFRLFESAKVFFDRDYQSVFDSREFLPHQENHVVASLVGSLDQAGLLFREGKGVVEALPRYLHVESLTMNQSQKPPWADDFLWLNVFSGDESVGNVGLLTRRIALACGIKNAAVVIMELKLDSLKPLPSRSNPYTMISEFPQSSSDLSLIVDRVVKWREITDVIYSVRDQAGLLRDVIFIEEYQGPQVGAGKKSITLRLVIGSFHKTLTSGEIEAFSNSVTRELAKHLGAELRSQ